MATSLHLPPPREQLALQLDLEQLTEPGLPLRQA
jgi:hypothetical protein